MNTQIHEKLSKINFYIYWYGFVDLYLKKFIQRTYSWIYFFKS